MTEEEAKTKWCPYVSTDNRGPYRQNDTYMRCIGSACMAWRWNGHRTDYDADVNATYPAVGFCGLAGKP